MLLVNLLYPRISIHILYTVLLSFPKLLMLKKNLFNSLEFLFSR